MGKRGKRLRRQRQADQRRAGGDGRRGELQSSAIPAPARAPALAGSYAGCHRGAVEVWAKGRLHLWCSDRASLGYSKLFDLYISAAGMACRAASPVFLTPGAAALLGYDPRDMDIGDLPHLFIETPDGDVPRLEAEHWANLATLLNGFADGQADGQKDVDVVVFCEGGHGRTGTVATVLLYFLGAFDDAAGGPGRPGAVDPVWWLRKQYCYQAVETFEQADYIENMTGLKVGVEPSWEWWLSSGPAKAPDTSGTAGGASVGPYDKPENSYEEVYVRDDAGLWRLTVNKAGDILYREKVEQLKPGEAAGDHDVIDGYADDHNVMVDPHTGEVLPRQNPPMYASWLGPTDPNDKAVWVLVGKPDRQEWEVHPENPHREADDKPWMRWLPNAAKAVGRIVKPLVGAGSAPLPPASTAQEVETH